LRIQRGCWCIFQFEKHEDTEKFSAEKEKLKTVKYGIVKAKSTLNKVSQVRKVP
jgi:hypothetical protein